jgi:hypothetical protein
MVWLGAPDQGAGSNPLRPLGRNGEEIELTVSSMQRQPQKLVNPVIFLSYKLLYLKFFLFFPIKAIHAKA